MFRRNWTDRETSIDKTEYRALYALVEVFPPAREVISTRAPWRYRFIEMIHGCNLVRQIDRCRLAAGSSRGPRAPVPVKLSVERLHRVYELIGTRIKRVAGVIYWRMRKVSDYDPTNFCLISGR